MVLCSALALTAHASRSPHGRPWHLPLGGAEGVYSSGLLNILLAGSRSLLAAMRGQQCRCKMRWPPVTARVCRRLLPCSVCSGFLRKADDSRRRLSVCRCRAGLTGAVRAAASRSSAVCALG